MDLVIKQNVNQQENGNSALLDLLYNLTKPDPITGKPSVDAVLVGRITVPAAYEDAVNFLNARFSVEQDNGSDFQITVLNNNYYIRFEDPVVEEVLRNSIGKGEGEGITVAEAATLNIGSLLSNNADIESFNEFKYFSKNNTNTAYQINNCGALSSIDLSECTNYPQRNFNDLPNLEYFHGHNSESGVLAFPEGTTSIPYLSFGNLPKLKHLIFPSTMRSVVEACHDCPNIETITLNPGFETFSGNSFSGSGNGKLIISDLNAFFNITWAPTYSWKNFFHKCPNFFLKDSNGDLTEITSVTIPQTMLAIPGAIFYVCKSLQNVVFHTGIISVGRGAFGWAPNLVIPDLNLPNLASLDNESFAGTKIQVISNLGSVTTIPERCFQDCSQLTTIHMPSSVTQIKPYAFSGCPNLVKFSETGTIGDLSLPNLSELGQSAFFNTGVIRILDLGQITNLPNSSFQNCKSLASLTIGNSITSISDRAFQGCSGLTSVTIPNTVTSIGSYAFNGSGLLSVTIPNSITVIPAHAFSQSPITMVTLPNTITRIDSMAFWKCYSLSTINFEEGLLTIGQHAIQYCKLGQVTLPNSLISIEDLAFYGSNITSVVIGTGIETIGVSCFTINPACTSITVKATNPPTLGKNAFDSTNNCPIYVPSGSVSAYQSASGWSTYADRIQAIP